LYTTPRSHWSSLGLGLFPPSRPSSPFKGPVRHDFSADCGRLSLKLKFFFFPSLVIRFRQLTGLLHGAAEHLSSLVSSEFFSFFLRPRSSVGPYFSSGSLGDIPHLNTGFFFFFFFVFWFLIRDCFLPRK